MKDFTHPKFPTIHIKLLKNTEYASQLQELLQFSGSSAEAVINFIPETSNMDAKYLYGIFDEEKLVGIIDVIEDYPALQTAYIHNFFLSSDYSNDNLAEMLYLALEKTVQETGIDTIEIDSAIKELPLWKNVAFTSNKKSI